MQSENRLFDDVIKGMCKMLGALCKVKKNLCNTDTQPSPSQEKRKEK